MSESEEATAAKALLDRALEHDEADEHEQELALYAELVERFATSADAEARRAVAWARNNTGLTLAANDRTDDALAAFGALLDDPSAAADDAVRHPFAHALLERAGLLAKHDRLDAAIADCDAVVARIGVEERNADIRRLACRALSKLGQLHHRQQRTDDVFAAYDELIARFGDTDSPWEGREIAICLRHRAELLGAQERHDEALVVLGGALSICDRIAAERDTPSERLREGAMTLLQERVHQLTEADRLDEAVDACEELIRRTGTSTPKWLRVEMYTVLQRASWAAIGAGRHAWAAGLSESAARVLSAPDLARTAPLETADDAYVDDLAALLQQTYDGDCWTLFDDPPEQRDHDAMAEQALHLFRRSAPAYAALTEDDDEDESPVDDVCFAAATMLRAIAMGYVRLSDPAALDDAARKNLPRRALADRAVGITGLDHWLEDHGHPLAPGLADDERVAATEAAVREQQSASEPDGDAFGRHLCHRLRAYELIAVVRTLPDAPKLLRPWRSWAVDQLFQAAQWMSAFEVHDPDGLAPAATLVIVEGAIWTACWSEDPAAEWYPSQQLLRGFVGDPDLSDWLDERGVVLPDWARGEED